jgi:hypothetical protein
MGKQSVSDRENSEFVQPEVALSDLPAIETAKWGSKTSQIQKNLMFCNLNLHIPAEEHENEKRQHVRTK